MTTHQEAPAQGGASNERLGRYTREELLAIYRKMRLIRSMEERIVEMYTRAKIGGYCHDNIGEEAAVVGIIGAFRPTDYIYTSYREHGYALARGIAPGAVMAELFGKVDGTSKGRGGSMHLFDAKLRFMGGYGIVGGQLAPAVGTAFACDYKGTDDIATTIFGDGATNIGAFHESLNFAKIWRCPVVFICTNNQYGMGSAISNVSAVAEIYKKACAYDMPGMQVDGQDVLAVRETVEEAARLAREARMPSLVEVVTYRYRGHSVADPGKVYRTQEEVNRWRQRDPIELFIHQLKAAGIVTDDDLRAADEEVRQAVNAAVDFAEQSPDPDPATDMTKYVYSGDYPPIEPVRREVT